MAVEPGMRAEVEHAVIDGDTAASAGSGDVDVLATPKVVALCECAAVKAVSGRLDEGQTTVGVRISIDHLAPTTVGRLVYAVASLEAVDGRTLEFAVEARDDGGVIARGLHTRVIVDRSGFMDGAAAR